MGNFNLKVVSIVLIVLIIVLTYMFFNLNKEYSKCNYRNEILNNEVEYLNDKINNNRKMFEDDIDALQSQLNKYVEKENDRIKVIESKNKTVNYLALSDLQLMQNPDENSTVIQIIKKNEMVGLLVNTYNEVYKYSNESMKGNYWWRVNFKNKTGWVISKYTYTDYLNNNMQKTRENLLIVQ